MTANDPRPDHALHRAYLVAECERCNSPEAIAARRAARAPKPVSVTLSDAEAQAIQYAYATLGTSLGAIRPDIRPTLTSAVARIAAARRYAPLTITD